MSATERWLLVLSDAALAARSVDDVLTAVGERVAEHARATTCVVLRREERAFRCLAARGNDAFVPGQAVTDADLVRFLGAGTVERLKGVRAVQDGGVRIAVELQSAGSTPRRHGAILLGREGTLAPGELEAVALAERIGELACAALTATPFVPTAGDRTAEHWEAIGRLTSTVLHELGNPVAFAALAASQIAQLARSATSDPVAADQARGLADDLALSVRQMADLLAELRRVSRGPEGARFIEPRAIVEGAVRLAHAELRGVASIAVEIGELPLLSGTAGSLGAGLAHLFSTVLRGHGGELSVRGHVDGEVVVLTVDGFDFRMPRATDAVRIVRGLAASAQGCTELTNAGTLVIRIPSVVEAAPPSSRRGSTRPRLLVVDDEVALARALAAALGSAFEVEIATSGDEALARIEQTHFDVVLCDVHLKGESGVALYERIVARVPRLAGRFALTSGGTDGATEERAREKGLPILGKPFDWSELEDELGRLADVRAP